MLFCTISTTLFGKKYSALPRITERVLTFSTFASPLRFIFGDRQAFSLFQRKYTQKFRHAKTLLDYKIYVGTHFCAPNKLIRNINSNRSGNLSFIIIISLTKIAPI